jgi:integrase
MRFRVSHIQVRKKSRFPRFRIPVPKDLQDRVGKIEITGSLGTTDPDEALAKATQLTLEWKQRFRDMRAAKQEEDLQRAPELVRDFLKQLADRRFGDLDGAIYGIQKVTALRLLTSWGPEEFYGRGVNRAIGFDPDPSTWESWQADPDPLSDIVAETERDGLVERLAHLNRSAETIGFGFRELLQQVQAKRRWDAVRFEILMIEQFANTPIPFKSPLYDAVAEHLIRQLNEYQSHRWNMDLLSALDLPNGSEERTPTGISVAALTGLAPPPGTETLSEPKPASEWRNAGSRAEPGQTLTVGLRRWIGAVAPGKSAITETTRAVERFVELYGDKHVALITDNVLFDYRDFLKKMPSGISLPAVKQQGMGLRSYVDHFHAEEAAREAEAQRLGHEPPEPRRLSPQSIKKDIGGLSAIFSALVSERWILKNPAEKIPIDGYSKRRKVFPLKPSMMKELFDSPMFTGCEGKTAVKRRRPGPHVFQDVLYWSFLFGATSGHRLAELGKARLEDVEEGVGPDGETIVGIFATDVKNEHSERVILVHPKLLELGFLRYVEDRRKIGATDLFDLPKGGQGENAGIKKLSEKVNEYLDSIIDDRRYVFHSLRHEFADRSEITISVEVSKKIMGHARGRLYGLGAPLHHAAAELKKLDVSFIDWDRLKAAARA